MHRDEEVMALVPIDWRSSNKIHVLVVPVSHYESVFDLPPALASPIQRLIRDVALAMKDGFGCTGISLRQSNEPDGKQDVWHHHTHVIGRFVGDRMESFRLEPNSAGERRPIVETLRAYLPPQPGPGDASSD